MKPVQAILTTSAALALAALTISCARQSPTAPRDAGASSQASSSLGARAPRAAAAGTIEGDIGPGAHYFIYVPEGWNGDLVLYAHGYTAPILPVGVPPNEQVLVDGLHAIAFQGGFAFAYSSYSQTGLGVKDAAQRTDQLGNLFTSLVAKPRRTFLIGTSFGALAAVKLVEAHPERYAGLLALCGMIGGAQPEIDYISHVRALFDYFYPNVLPGNVLTLPAGFNPLTDIQGPVVAAIAAHPEGAGAMSQIAQTPIPFSDANELVGSIVQALILQALELQDLLERTHGQSFFDNSGTVYTGNLPPELLADLNAHVARYTEGPAAARLLAQYYAPSGDLHVPTISLYTSLDPVVPTLHEDLYRSLVESRGLGANWHEVRTERYGHLNLLPEEIVTAFGAMIGAAQAAPAP